jgi:glycosyltransferase involved in cell wall biosynthesis
VNVGFYAPLPPAPTGVADYAAALLGALRQIGPVTVNPAQCDAPLYQLGNNPLHREIYCRALQHPGVAVLHDAVLHHFLLGSLSPAEYVEEFVYNYGAWSRGIAEELWQGRAAAAGDPRYFQYPMLRRVAERSRAIVVHNPAAARMVRQHNPASPVVEIPHLFQPPELPAESQVARFRQQLGVPPGAFLFGVFGYLRESKRLQPVLDSFAQLRREAPQAALLVAGKFVGADLERAVSSLLRQDGVFRLPFLSESDFWLAASAVDACLNLRDPAAGETSGISIRLMGIGKPVLLTANEENASFPEDACLRIAPGLAERESLHHHMLLLTSIPRVHRAIGSRAAAYIQAEHSLERVAHLYWNTLCEHCS